MNWFIYEGLTMVHQDSMAKHGTVTNLRRELLQHPKKPEGEKIITAVCDLEYSDGSKLISVPLYKLVHIDKVRKGR